MKKMNWDIDLFNKMINEGYVSVNKHPTADLYIYNYTPKAQFDWVWNEVTMKCRGLILDGKGNIIARPFEKFFSADQIDDRTPINIPNEPFEAFEKIDGCCDGGVIIETEDGVQTIKNICENNYRGHIKSYDHNTCQETWDEIVATQILPDDREWFELELVDGTTIRLTGNHRVWCEDLQCYRRVDKLTGTEDFLLREGGMKLKSIRKIENQSKRYDIETRHHHNFFANNMLVHNSLGIMFWTYDINNDLLPLIATRGSFISDQACIANDMLYDRYTHERKLDNGCTVYTLAEELAYYCNPSWTYLFEIIYPKNRIVVDYGDDHKLILIAIINTETGEEISLKNAPPCVEVVKRYDGVKDWQTITEQFDGDGREGFVIRFESGFRLKVKYEEYKRLHRIICNTSERTVWEHLMFGDPIESLIKNVPDEFYKWLIDTIEKLQFRFQIIEDFCKLQMDEIKVRLEELGDTSRKAWALEIQKIDKKYQGILFAMLTGWQPNKVRLSIWRMIQPEAIKPFQQEEN